MTSVTQPKEYHLATIERRLQQLELELQQLARETEQQSVAKPSTVLAELRASFDEKRRRLRRQLAEAHEAGESATVELKDGIEAAWADLRSSVARARSVLKGKGGPSHPPAA